MARIREWGWRVAGAALMGASIARAGTGPGGTGGVSLDNPLGGKGFQQVLSSVFTGLIQIAAPVVAIMVLVGGFQIMTAQGNEEKVTAGRNTITYAVIGFAIMLLAQAVVSIVKSFLQIK